MNGTAARAWPTRDFQYSFGLEEEYFLACASTGELAARMPAKLLAEARAQLGDTVTTELLQSQIEIASPIFRDCHEARETMLRSRRVLADVVRSMDLNLIAAGTHPLGDWNEQFATDLPRYDQLISDFRIISHRNLVCGLHIHVATPPGVDRVDLMNRAMPWLPVFLALSTSSPFWNRRVTGLLSYRQALYDEWPRSGIPDFFLDEQDYRTFVARMERAGAICNSSQLWWAVRPALRFPTLELRISDACTRLEDGLAIASLFRCLVATLVENPELGRHRSTHTRRIIDENRWRAKRDGTQARFMDEASDELVPVERMVHSLLALIEAQTQRLDCAETMMPLGRILSEGTSAHAQLRVYNTSRAAGENRSQALARVMDWLTQTTAGAGLPLTPGSC